MASYAVSSPTLVFSAETIEHLKGKLNSIAHLPLARPALLPHEKQLTETDCISGLVWVATARARYDLAKDSPAQPIYFRTAVNAREKLNPPLPNDYLGIMFEHATSQSNIRRLEQVGDGRNGPITVAGRTDLLGYLFVVAGHAVTVRQAIDGVNDTSMCERLSRIAQLGDVQDTVSAIPAFDKANGLDFGSLATFGADLEFDIPGTASSRADFCRKVMPGQEGIANVLPRCCGTQGGADWEVVVSLRAEHAEKMVKELKDLGLVDRVANM